MPHESPLLAPTNSQMILRLTIIATALASIMFLVSWLGFSYGYDRGHVKGFDAAVENCVKNPKYCRDVYYGNMADQAAAAKAEREASHPAPEPKHETTSSDKPKLDKPAKQP